MVHPRAIKRGVHRLAQRDRMHHRALHVRACLWVVALIFLLHCCGQTYADQELEHQSIHTDGSVVESGAEANGVVSTSAESSDASLSDASSVLEPSSHTQANGNATSLSFTEMEAGLETQETPGIPIPKDAYVDPNEVDPRTPDPKHHSFHKPYAPVNVDIEPIAGGVIRMDLKQLEADAACFCHLPDRVRKLEGSECLIPHRITIHKDISWRMQGVPEASPAVLQRLVGSINEVRLVTSSHSSFACVDGRQVHIDQPRTFGGDMGEMIQVLSFVEMKRGRPLSGVEVDQFFEKWISQVRGKGLHEQFYFSTDTNALMRLTQWLRDNFGLFGGQLLDLTNVPAFLARPVLNGLKQSVHHGNLPIRLMLEFPDKFSVVPGVAHKLFEAFFNLMWRRDKEFQGELLHRRLQFVVSEGLHQERVFLDIRNSAYCSRENIYSVLTLSKLGTTTKAAPGVSPSSAKAVVTPHYSHEGRETEIANQNVGSMLKHEKEAREQAGKNALPHMQSRSGFTKRIVKNTAFLETETTVMSEANPRYPDIAKSASESLHSRLASTIDDPKLLEGKARDEISKIVRPTEASYDTKTAHEELKVIQESSEDSVAQENIRKHTLIEEPVNMTKEAIAERRRVQQEQMESAKENQEFMKSLVETLGYDYKRHAVDNPDARRHADSNYPWKAESSELVADSRYKPQDGMQAFIFNSQAAESLRREMLTKALATFKLGKLETLWSEYNQLMKTNDGLFTQLMANGIPTYVVFMT